MKRCLLVLVLLLVWSANAQASVSVHRYQTGQPVRNLTWLLAGHKPSVYRIDGWRHPSLATVYDKRVVNAVANVKYRLGFPKSQLGGTVAGPRLIAILKGERKRPFAWKVRTGNLLAARVTGTVIEDARIRALVSDANYLIAHAKLVDYSQSSRMQIVRERLTIPRLSYRFSLGRAISEDCSSSVTGLYWLAAGGSQTNPHPTGLPDPNGYTSPPFNGYGYTGTLATHGRVVWRLGQSLGLLRPGDLILYAGGFPFRHVTMYLGGGRVFSHGTNTGPFNLPVLYRSDAVSAHRYVG